MSTKLSAPNSVIDFVYNAVTKSSLVKNYSTHSDHLIIAVSILTDCVVIRLVHNDDANMSVLQHSSKAQESIRKSIAAAYLHDAEIDEGINDITFTEGEEVDRKYIFSRDKDGVYFQIIKEGFPDVKIPMPDI